jgi:hypothetical protein
MKSMVLASGVLIVALAACGGGGSTPGAIPSAPPATFASSASSRTVYEPLSITGQTMSLAAPVPVYSVGTNAVYSFASEPGELLPPAFASSGDGTVGDHSDLDLLDCNEPAVDQRAEFCDKREVEYRLRMGQRASH